ncbi:response regulator [Peribacillus kribbensis]|uniref:response regulator n=1 Tax=Peribacillus kribbensis TaxID=356658 RepID=UPI000428E35C|nr:response regulator [Peribacillus kribbensis]
MNKLKAAITEDDFRIADIHEKFLLEYKEFQVVGKALNGLETLHILRTHQPDLLLLDVYLPDMLGTELLPAIREEFPKMGIVLITAATDKTVIEQALSYGVDYYLIKPVNRGRFDEVISGFIKKHSLLRSNQEVDQAYVDVLFGQGKKERAGKIQGLPKGIDEITLGKVKGVLLEKGKGLSAEEAGKEIGASRITARRYLEYLASVQEAKTEVVYGIVGRPERKYFPV